MFFFLFPLKRMGTGSPCIRIRKPQLTTRGKVTGMKRPRLVTRENSSNVPAAIFSRTSCSHPSQDGPSALLVD